MATKSRIYTALLYALVLFAPPGCGETEGENAMPDRLTPDEGDTSDEDDVDNSETLVDCAELDAESCAAATHCRIDDATTWDPVTRCVTPVFFRCLDIGAACNSVPATYLGADGICVTTANLCAPTDFVPDGYQSVEFMDIETACGYGADIHKPDSGSQYTCE